MARAVRHNLAVEPRSHSERVLELDRVMEMVAERCSTSLGVSLISALKPSFDAEVVRVRIAQTEQALSLLRNGEPPAYGGAKDVRDAVSQAGKGSTMPGEEIFRVAETLDAMNRLRKYLNGKREESNELWRIAESMPYLPELHRDLVESVTYEGEVLDSASPALKRVRLDKNAQSRRLASRVQTLINGSLKTYLQEPIFTIRDGRYVVPVKAQYRGKVPGIVHDASGSGQTIFVEPESIVGEANKLRELEAAEREEVERVLRELSNRIGEQADPIAAGLDSIAEIDTLFAKARFGIERKCVAPKLVAGRSLKIESGHHPLIDPSISVPLDVTVGESSGSLLITGPNTGGKTVTLKMLGLYAMMIGCGMLVPAAHVEYGVFGRVWADIGDEQSLQQSLSTFSGHLRNIAAAFKDSKNGDLVLLDEVGAGTDPREGSALAQAILETLADRGVVIAASTHYGELKAFSQSDDRFCCAAMEFDVATLRPTYRLIPGASGQSHALEVSRRHGIPGDVVDLAESMLGSDAAQAREKSTELDRLLMEARREREEIAEVREGAIAVKREAEAQVEAQLEKLRKARDRAEQVAADALRESREKYRELLDIAKSASASEREMLLERAKRVEDDIRAAKAEIAPDVSAAQESALKSGMYVRIASNNQHGRILEIQKSGKVLVQVGAMKITLSPTEVIPAEEKPSDRSRKSMSASVHRTMSAKTEISLRQMRAESALEELDRFFDDAVLAGLPMVRIVHGKGEGVLRRVVREFLSKRSDVERVREGEPGEGGGGVTVVYLK